jgi:hypothetical protein
MARSKCGVIGNFTAGVYPMQPVEVCWSVAIGFDRIF